MPFNIFLLEGNNKRVRNTDDRDSKVVRLPASVTTQAILTPFPKRESLTLGSLPVSPSWDALFVCTAKHDRK